MTTDHRLKVGIDFGTTYSGVAWTDTAKPDDVVVIMKWPGTGKLSEKVPSEISYKPTGEVHKWGFEIKPGDERLAWMKLLLDPGQYASDESSMLTRTKNLIPNAKERQPVDVIADYLSCLRKHILATIKGNYGAAFLEVTPIDYILTVPAIWTDTAKDLTLQAAETAGFGTKDKIKLVSEPDAAAAWTLLRDIKPTNLKVGDVFVVVDCGGGTIDLISYKVMQLSPKFTVEECAKGTGGLCGSTFLNQAFEDLVRSRIRKRFDKMKPGPRNTLLRAFEDLKRDFSNAEDEDIFTCPISGIPDNPALGIEEGGFIFTRDEMLNIFDPVINQIIPLVQGQIDMVESQHQGESPISSVLLVGGFGASEYLFQRLQQEITIGKGPQRSPVEILQPVNAWSAVARGAAVGIRISSRRARRHYGTQFATNFVFGKHNLKNLVYSKFDGAALCSGCLEWYIKQGDQVSEDAPIWHAYVQDVSFGHNMIFYNTLYECNESPPPDNIHDAELGVVKQKCTLVSDFSEVPKELFTKHHPKNRAPYYSVRYRLVMTIDSSAMLVFHAEFDGKKIGTVTANYDFT